MSSSIVRIVNENGKAVHRQPVWFPEDHDLGSDHLTIIAVLGAQASGKSTLLNKVLGTNFPIGSRSAVGTATTKGISAAKAEQTKHIVALDIEGSDSRERGKEGRVFHAKCAGFATAVSDIILLNMWYHDVGRLDSACYSLLAAVFAEAEKSAAGDPNCFKTALVFVVRDVEEDADLDALEALLIQDASDVWSKTQRESTVTLEDLFDMSTSTLPHMRHCPDGFAEGCTILTQRIMDEATPDFLAREDYSKSIPADGCGTFAVGLWESNFESADAAAVSGVSGQAGGEQLIAAFKCNEAFSEAFAAASVKLSEFSRTLDDGEKIKGYGKEAAAIMATALQAYDDATSDVGDEAIQARKRRELEAIIDTSQHAIYMRQLQVLRENALLHFKTATSAEEMPSDFAFYNADALFNKEAEESKRPGSSWGSSQERLDLQNMMQEISTQRKRLLTSQVSAAQQQAHAMQYLQMQQSYMTAIQAQAYGGGGPGQWNVGAAYRPPDTNINASLSYQQGRTNIQISMVPDESASLLGPNGFTAGVGPGNLGLSFNIG